jgi:hypothetical protein
MGLFAVRIGSDRCDERGRRTEPRGSDGLVTALASVVLSEPPAGDRLALLRQALRYDNEIDVERADDDDPSSVALSQ